MKLRYLLPLLAAAGIARADNEIGFVEKFALAADREKVLLELVPGSEDYYFYHALHFQNTRQADKLAAILQQWSQRIRNSPRRKIIENREALLAYDADPQKTLQFLQRHFNLQFTHEQDSPGAKPNLPSQLDPARIAREKYLEEALRHDGLENVNVATLEQLVADKVALRPPQRRAVLARMVRPDVPNLVELIVEELKSDQSKGFGEFPIHTQLLPDQLAAIAKAIPSLASENAMVFALLRKLAPGADEDPQFDPASREAWLDRAWNFVKTLPPSQNSLKAAVLFRRLEHDRAKGTYDAARLVEYLKLPRQTGYAAPKWIESLRGRGAPLVDLNASFQEAGFEDRAIRNDEPLIREYFLAIFAAEPAKSWEPYAEWVRDTWLKPVFAEAMIVNGIGNPEKWASLLSPAAYQRLKDRVDLDFAGVNPPFIAPADDVTLDLWVKNAPKLIVKIYEINALNWFLTHKKQLNTDLPLDGLVANSETTHEYGEPPTRRIKRTFTFPELKGRRGAWMIEFVGGGKSSRALIRKGRWHLVQRVSPGGDLLTVLDENHAPVKDAAIWLDGRKFPMEDGAIPGATIPFTANAARKPVVLADAAGTFATLAEFEHHAEVYLLDAQFHVEREQLLAGKEAIVAIRTGLWTHDSQVSMALLKNPKLTISTTTIDGIETIREIPGIKLDATREFTQAIPVPDRLRHLKVRLSGQIEQLSKGGELLDVSSERSWDINGVDGTDATYDAHLVRTAEGWFVDLLGKNGEPIPNRAVNLHLIRRGFTHPITFEAASNDKGRIALGPLDGMDSIRMNWNGGRSWDLHANYRTSTDEVHVVAGQPFELPNLTIDGKSAYSVFELKGGTLAANVTALASPANLKDGEAQQAIHFAKGLPPGDYRLVFHDTSRAIAIKASAGTAALGWVFGKARHLELASPKPLSIRKVDTTPAELVLHLANITPATRVHVAASRVSSPGFSLFSLSANHRPNPASEGPAKLPNLYAAGRDIGDEYRYILERRYALKFPGNMLTRPGLLLNPWDKRTTDESAIAQSGTEAPPATAGARGAVPRAQKKQNEAEADFVSRKAYRGEGPHSANLDFLANVAPVYYNLVPAEDGTLKLDRKLFGDRQYIQIYAEDLRHGVWQAIPLPEADTKKRDLRLVRSLDPAKPFTEKKEVAILAKGNPLAFPDMLSSEFKAYDSLGSVYSLLQTLSQDDTLPKFAWLIEWPKLKPEEKLAKYSEFACHELSFFLSRKDPEFFAKVIQPYLRNKKDKTFMDEYLIGADLARFVEPWAFHRLNAVERALLASRIQAEAPTVARHLRELWELLPADTDEKNRLFETALRGKPGEAGPEAEMAAAEPAIPGLEPADAAPAPAAPPVAAPAAASRAAKFGLAKDALGSIEKLERRAEVRLEENVAGRFITQLDAKAVEGQVALADAYFLGDAAEGIRGRMKAAAYYRKLGPAKEWAENNYYRLAIERQNAQLVTVNAFWRDFAAWVADGGKAPFLSQNVAEAHRNFTEIVLALAVLDLPFESPKHETKVDGGSFTLTSGGAAIVYHKQVLPAHAADPAAPKPELLISQNFFRASERHRQVGNETFDNYITGEFLAGAVYGTNIVVTNPASAPAKLDLLLQIPKGALPVNSSKATNSFHVRLEPYTTKTFEYYFYFPQPGADAAKFPHYPVNASIAGVVAASAKPFAFHVVPKLTEVDKTSWDYISQFGSEADVLAFLEKNNVERLDLVRIAWRVRKNAEFFRNLVAVLQKRHRFDDTIYCYSVMHNDAPSLAVWLRHKDDLVEASGRWLDTKLVRLDPIERGLFEQLEYSPLVNQRTHRLGGENRIANNIVLAQYRSLLDVLGYKPALSPQDQMRVVTFLFLQDRVEEAIARLKLVDAASLATRIQHDYFRCYAAFYEADLPAARGIANQYASHPVERWRKLFGDVLSQIGEIEGQAQAERAKDAPDRERETADAANAQATFDFKVENRTLSLTWRNLDSAALNYYLIDPEFSFSSNPFVSEDAGRFAIVKPAKSAQVALPKDKNAMDIPLPAEFAKANVVVEIVAAGQRKAEAYHANTLQLSLAENYGRIHLRDAASKPVPKAYVKVYARLKNGTVRFFKDGYTDLRGRFDYASLNSSDAIGIPRPVPHRPAPDGGTGMNAQMLRPGELDQVARFSILVMSEANGTLVREASPPSE